MESARFLVFTDGACSKNGRAGARASFAVVGAVATAGLVEAATYRLVDARAPELGFVSLADSTNEAGCPAPSNNRGELLAIAHALLGLLRLVAVAPPALQRLAGAAAAAPPAAAVLPVCELVSDSRISLMTLSDWLPARRRKGTAHQLCNFDLVEIAEALLAALRAVATVVLTHVNSHTPAPPASAPARARALWAGNAAADAAATAALEN